jgi:hypothetical protein
VAQAFPATGPAECGGPSSTTGCRGGEEKEGRGEGPGPRADAGSGRLGKAPSSAGEGGTPEEPSPETPDDDDDDEDDDEEDDMAARLGFSPGLRLGQEPSSQPPSELMPSVPGVGTLRSRPEERGQTEGYLTPWLGKLRRPRGAGPRRLFPVSRRPHRQRRRATLKSPWRCLGSPSPGRPKRPKQGWCRSYRRSGPRRRLRGSRSERPPLRHG